MHPVAFLLGVRALFTAAALLLVSVAIFAGTEIIPGDAAQAILGPRATPESLAALRAQLHLTDPAPIRYLNWLAGMVHGDFGKSVASVDKRPVIDIIGPRLLNSAIIGVPAAVLVIILAIGLGVLAALRADSLLDRAISTISLAAGSIPEFVIGSLLIVVFAVWLGLLPSTSLIPYLGSPLQRPEILVLPILTLLSVSLAQNIRLVRANMIEALRSDFVEAARLNGVDEWLVTWRYALPSALAPAVAVLARYVAYLVGGAIVVETLFGYGGMGPAYIVAIAERDVPVVQAISIILAALTICTNLVADVVALALIPRLRTA